MRTFFLCLLFLAQTAWAQHEHGGEAENVAVSFKESEGLLIEKATRTAIGLTLAEVEERIVAPRFEIIAQVYRTGSETLASAQVAPETAALLKPDQIVALHPAGDESLLANGTVVSIERAIASASSVAEAIISIPSTVTNLHLGDFVHVWVESGEANRPAVTAIPATALLRNAYGTFVYTQNGQALLRVPVEIGVVNTEWMEVTDGLFAGDVVAAQPVEWLYLIELRATKGGGHCH